MLKTIDQKLIERANKAIINIRFVASVTKRPVRLQAQQTGEFIVTCIDAIRRLCKENVGVNFCDLNPHLIPDKHKVSMVLDVAILRLVDIRGELSEANKKRYDARMKQVYQFISDMCLALTSETVTGGPYAKRTE